MPTDSFRGWSTSRSLNEFKNMPIGDKIVTGVMIAVHVPILAILGSMVAVTLVISLPVRAVSWIGKKADEKTRKMQALQAANGPKNSRYKI